MAWRSTLSACAGLVLGMASCVPPTADAGQPDSGVTIVLHRDAGVLIDGGAPGADAGADAGPVDGGRPTDAGGGVRDASVPSPDAGPDGGEGVFDGGLPVDGGADGGAPPAGLCASGCPGQHDVMLQAFYWDPPVDAAGRDGFWWDHLVEQMPALRAVGVTALWLPSPAKGNFGIYDMGYGIYDLFDLGNYEQKGTVETRFGSRAELEALLAAAHDEKIEVYADIVLNHLYTGDDNLEPNPAVGAYVDAGAVVDGVARTLVPTDELLWSVPASPGAEVVVDVGGYRLPWAAFDGERAFQIEVVSGGAPTSPDLDGGTGLPVWHMDADGGVTPLVEGGVHGIVEGVADVDTFSVLATDDTLVLRLRSRRIGDDGPEPNSTQHGYRLLGARVDGVAAPVAVLTGRG